MQKIKTGQIVKVVRGADSGKEGEVLKVMKNKKTHRVEKVIVRGVNVVKKHVKPNPTLNVTGGIFDVEKPIDVSNVQTIDIKKTDTKRTKKEK